MSSQMSTFDSIEDQRFAELLKPIKDLTQNWEVTSLLTDIQFYPILFTSLALFVSTGLGSPWLQDSFTEPFLHWVAFVQSA